MLAPQCPEHLRWSTDDWFENFYKEVIARYRIDADRIYLTGPSLGGSGTWYIAARYPETFAAIAPISGFTSHLDYIDKNIDKLLDMPVWAFHGKLDTVVPFEETERIVRRLEGRNRNLRFSAEPDHRPLDPLAGLPGPGDLRLAAAIRQEIEEVTARAQRRQGGAPAPRSARGRLS